MDPSVLVSTKDVRRGLSMRIVGTEYVGDHTVYIVFVADVETGAEWEVPRRFREFYELQEHLVSLRPSISTLDFPARRPSLAESMFVVHERRVKLERYLRRVAGLLFYSPLHSASLAVAKAFQDFLDVPKQMERLTALDEMILANNRAMLMSGLSVKVHRVLHVPIVERMITEFVDRMLGEDPEDPSAYAYAVMYGHAGWTGQEMLEHLRRFMDRLQSCVIDGCAAEWRPFTLGQIPDLRPEEVDSMISGKSRPLIPWLPKLPSQGL